MWMQMGWCANVHTLHDGQFECDHAYSTYLTDVTKRADACWIAIFTSCSCRRRPVSSDLKTLHHLIN